MRCGSRGKISLAGGLSHIAGLGSGVGGFVANAVGGNAFSGLTDLISSFDPTIYASNNHITTSGYTYDSRQRQIRRLRWRW